MKIDRILDSAVLKFFPEDGDWYANCFKRSENLDMSNLPCHLRDDLWLAKMLKINQNLFYVSTERILEYIIVSPYFKEKRYEYEQKIVKWQITWMINGGGNWCVDDKYGGDFVFLSPLCDIGFRKGIVDTLLKIGMNKDAIEEGIEKNASKWRDTLMNKAFDNAYNPYFLNLSALSFFGDKAEIEEDKNILEPVNPKFKEKWIQFRKYEYYQNHKESVDKYGKVENDMIINNEEVDKLRKYLNRKHDERKAQIDNYENSNKKVLIKK